MIRLRPVIFCLAVTTAGFTASAQTPPPPPSTFSGASLPPLPTESPVKFFRELLALPPAERANALTNRSSAAQAKIMAKLAEYAKLDPDERELRLRATELRWYLLPLLPLTSAQREPRLAKVPADLHGLVKSRLKLWDMLPPPLQTEFLNSDHAVHYFAHVETEVSAAADQKSQKAATSFNQFFELTDPEKEDALSTLSEAERAAMEKTLHSFDQLPPQQRQECVRNYAKFAGMSSAERAEFLKNAQQWSQMSPKERQSWRDLVAHVPPWPPLPPIRPPLPPLPPGALAPKIAQAAVATN